MPLQIALSPSRLRICSIMGKQIMAWGPRRQYAGTHPRSNTRRPSFRTAAVSSCAGPMGSVLFIPLVLSTSKGAATVVLVLLAIAAGGINLWRVGTYTNQFRVGKPLISKRSASLLFSVASTLAR